MAALLRLGSRAPVLQIARKAALAPLLTRSLASHETPEVPTPVATKRSEDALGSHHQAIGINVSPQSASHKAAQKDIHDDEVHTATPRLLEVFDYDNILLLPRKCKVASRSECDTSVVLGRMKFKMPVVPANMKTVVNEEICEWMARNGYFYVMHRFDNDNVAFVRNMHSKGLYSSISLGIKKEDYATVDKLVEEDLVPEFITIDVAHGHSDLVRDMIVYIKKNLPASYVIAGNVGTPEAVVDMERWGADATKVGIGPGKVCITKLKTGFGTGGWQLSAVKWCARVATKPIIADGGIREHGDIGKSIRFGATMVMIGSLMAGHEESPGRTVEVDGKLFKEYYGSASDLNKGEKKHVEGKRILEPIKGKLEDTLREMREDVQSSISYAGGKKLMDIRKVNYVILGGDNAHSSLLTHPRSLYY